MKVTSELYIDELTLSLQGVLTTEDQGDVNSTVQKHHTFFVAGYVKWPLYDAFLVAKELTQGFLTSYTKLNFCLSNW